MGASMPSSQCHLYFEVIPNDACYHKLNFMAKKDFPIPAAKNFHCEGARLYRGGWNVQQKFNCRSSFIQSFTSNHFASELHLVANRISDQLIRESGWTSDNL